MKRQEANEEEPEPNPPDALSSFAQPALSPCAFGNFTEHNAGLSTAEAVLLDGGRSKEEANVLRIM